MIFNLLSIGKVISQSNHLGLGLTDYPFIIKNPMDLNTVNNKLRDDKYRYLE